MLTYRWLGVAGVEFKTADYSLLIDPFFTRPRILSVLLGKKAVSNSEWINRYAPVADTVLVTHPHHDHLMDVPEILRRTGACGYGSKNTGLLLSAQGIPNDQIRVIASGDDFHAGPFDIEVLPAAHTRVPFFSGKPLSVSRRVSTAVVEGKAIVLRLSDFRMDACFSFLLKYQGVRILIGNTPVPTDWLFIAPYLPLAALQTTLESARPRWIVPIHWDDFTRSIDQPLRPMLLTHMQGLPRKLPPVGRIDLDHFARFARSILPDVQILVPTLFQTREI